MDRPMEHRPTILVPLDGSSFSEAILGTVAALARPLQARVLLLTVDQPAASAVERPREGVARGSPAADGAVPGAVAPLAPPIWRSPTQAVDEILTGYLRSVASELEGIDVRLMVDVADDPAALIIARARQEHADLIAMATHGRSGISHLLAGSVCEKVIRSGVAPVVVLRP